MHREILSKKNYSLIIKGLLSSLWRKPCNANKQVLCASYEQLNNHTYQTTSQTILPIGKLIFPVYSGRFTMKVTTAFAPPHTLSHTSRMAALMASCAQHIHYGDTWSNFISW